MEWNRMECDAPSDSNLESFCPWNIFPEDKDEKPEKTEIDVKNLVRPGLWAQSYQIPEIKRRLREKVPKAVGYFVRKGNPDEQVVNYLYHKGFEKSGMMLEKLLETEKELFKSKNIPEQLRTSRELLIKVADALKGVESGDETIFALVLLSKSLYSKSKSYEWISHMIFDYALDLATKIRNDDSGYMEAKVRYPFGQFLVDVENYEKAVEVLEIGYSLTLDKNWRCFTPGRTLFASICNLLCSAHLKIAEELKKDYLEKAFEHSKKCVKYALQAKNKFAVAPAYIVHAKITMDTGDYKNALDYLYKALQFAQESQDKERICEANLIKALCLHKMGKHDCALKCAGRTKAFATKAELSTCIARSCMIIGYLHENMKQLPEAVSNYIHAQKEYRVLNDMNSMMEAKFLCGQAFADMVFNSYFQLLQQITKSEKMENALFSLTLWKEKRVPFWDDQNDQYDTLDMKTGFYDDYRVDNFLIKDTEIVYWSRLKSAIFAWGPSSAQPFSKRLVGELNLYRKILYLF